LLVPQRDPVALSAAILRLLDDPAGARAMGERGRARSNSRDWSHVVDEYLALYQRALSGR
jgi:glycosyltransferase involved in cell wall biosynthesis